MIAKGLEGRSGINAGRRTLLVLAMITAAGLTRAQTGNHDQALIEAAANGDADKVRNLIAAGADPNVRDMRPIIMRRIANHYTPLMYAAQEGNFALVEWLIDHGARIDVVGRDGGTPLSVAIVSHSDAEPPPAISPGHIRVITILLQRGAPVNAASGQDANARPQSALIAAAERRSAEVLDLLLRHGAAINAVGWTRTSSRPKSPLSAAAVSAPPAILERLIAAGADVNLVPRLDGYAGAPPLLAATAAERQDNVALLLRHGANANLAGEDFMNGPGTVPLVAAVGVRNMGLIQMLLAAQPSRGSLEAAIARARNNWNGVLPGDAEILATLQAVLERSR